MQRAPWIAPLSAMCLVGMACSLATTPLSQAQDLALTAEAFATTVPSGMPGIEGMPDIPGVPDATVFLHPSGSPASEWRGIPIMPEASAGEEFDSNIYSFRAARITGIEVEEFYDAQLEILGWSSPVRTNVGTAGGYMLFTNGTDALSIMVTRSEGDIVVLLLMQ
ncbi:MAG: hypothetical protein V1755_05915 [Chloroflexota bacterium]